MTPIKVTFASGEFLMIYSDDPDSFSKSIADTAPPEIRTIEFDSTTEAAEVPNLQAVQIGLGSGAVLLCQIAEDQVAKAFYIEEITDCTTSSVLAYGKMVRTEKSLDERLIAVKAVINNIPDLETRQYLHEEYLKRKGSYLSSLEAIIDGVMRRPDK